MKKNYHLDISRRRFVSGAAAGGLLYGLGGLTSSFADISASLNKLHGPQVLRGSQFDLNINYQMVNFTGTKRQATGINGSIPCPTLYWKEGERVTLRVTNHLAHDSSIHWHGIILPADMDGVPGISFGGIKPGETFEYQFDVNQSGTYWYHSHSGFQEQTGMYGAIVIEPKDPDPVSYDREHVVVLSDWSDEDPNDIYANLKKMSDYYNFRERTVSDLWSDIRDNGVSQTWNERSMWNNQRMSDRDISDVTGYTYTYLMNGITPDDGWLGGFKRGEKVRLRFINAAAMTIFDVRIPGLKMKVVASDGQNIEPVTIDEFRIGVAETYDVVVEPNDDSAYTIFAQSIDRTGYTRGTLTPNVNMTAEIPSMDHPPILGHQDMGMGGMAGMKNMEMGMDHSNMQGMDHSNMKGMAENTTEVLGTAGFGSTRKLTHVETEFGPHVDMRAETPQSGLNDPGIGLRDHQQIYGRRVLTYADISNLYPTADPREPSREIELHLTGNMSRYMWSINGIKFADAEPLQLKYGERVRITLVNDTMMSHPMHLHGMWSELETEDPKYIPRKHTVIVQPGSKISYLVTADALGRWAYHCHLLYHMPGMFREVSVS
ncbi:MAG: copper resistance system multicopper oxidase [Piscirickettsiaceae bacterium]|nr:copper resistance system multicopper oxidase [Piscirickettsiaceae bacterium]